MGALNRYEAFISLNSNNVIRTNKLDSWSKMENKVCELK